MLNGYQMYSGRSRTIATFAYLNVKGQPIADTCTGSAIYIYTQETKVEKL